MKDQLTNDPNFAASIKNAGVHDPLFLHETPVADFIILTFEGGDFKMLTQHDLPRDGSEQEALFLS